MSGPAVVVSGALANKPANGGEAWVRMSWVRGLQNLGCRVTFVEQIAESVCVDDLGHPAAAETSRNRRWFDAVIARFGLIGASSLVCRGRHVTGLDVPTVEDLIGSADLLVNISGNLVDDKLRAHARRRVYVDLDPGFTQFWADGSAEGFHLGDHDLYFTVGANVGTTRSSIPTGGTRWVPLWPPVVLGDWPATPPAGGPMRRFTTVATWRGPYGPVVGTTGRLGQKVHEFRKYLALPEAVEGAAFEVALSIDPADAPDIELLDARGWRLVDPAEVAGSADAFSRYVACSDAEFSVAQEMYVATRSGWFSDRTTRYLASGRPVLVQDTGFSDHLPTGEGLVSFTDLGSAVDGARAILRDYARHADAARRIAEDHFDSDRVLAGFLERCLP